MSSFMGISLACSYIVGTLSLHAYTMTYPVTLPRPGPWWCNNTEGKLAMDIPF